MREYLTKKQLETFSFEKIRRIQNLRFSATCEHLLPQTPFYAQLFKTYGIDPKKLKTVEDWQKQGLPLIKKNTYLKKPRDFIVKPKQQEVFTKHLAFLDRQTEYKNAFDLLFTRNKHEELKAYYTPKMLIFSGGTESGTPAPVVLTATQKFDIFFNILSLMSKIIQRKKQPYDVGMNVFPYAPHLGWHAVHHALDIYADFNLCTAAGGAMPTERLIKLAHESQPTIICGMSDYLRNRFLPLAIKQKIKLPNEVLFITGAQKLHEAERQKISTLAKKLGAKKTTVLDFYGASEFKEAILPECKPGSGYHHIAPLSTIIKTVHANHATREYIDDWDFSDNGYAASWNIDGAGTLLHGYFIGDRYEKISTSRCPHCNLNVERIHGVNRITAVEAQLQLTGIVEENIKGTRVNLSALRDKALKHSGVQEAQIRYDKRKKRILLRIVGTTQAKKDLEKTFKHAEIQPQIERVALDTLISKKIKFEPIKL